MSEQKEVKYEPNLKKSYTQEEVLKIVFGVYDVISHNIFGSVRWSKKFPEIKEQHDSYDDCNLLNSLIGIIKTHIDATISDKEQRKATKNIVEQAFWNRTEHKKDVIFALMGEILENKQQYRRGVMKMIMQNLHN